MSCGLPIFQFGSIVMGASFSMGLNAKNPQQQQQQ
jgi:hypothetical protein